MEYLVNNEDECNSYDSRIGFDTDGYPDDTNTCGNVARHKADNDDKNIKTMGYILVRFKTTMNFNLSRAWILKTSKHRVPFFCDVHYAALI